MTTLLPAFTGKVAGGAKTISEVLAGFELGRRLSPRRVAASL